MGLAREPRVHGVVAAVREDFDAALVPSGIDTVVLPKVGWVRHLLTALDAVAREVRADIVFSPNGLQPRHPRSVVYFQDVHHFSPSGLGGGRNLQFRLRRLSHWYTDRCGGLAICVSDDVQRMVRGCLRVPTVVIPNGVEVDGYRWRGDSNAVFVMGGAGHRKSEETAVRAWFRIPATLRSGRRLVVGGVEPAARRERLRRIVDGEGGGNDVLIRGTMDRATYLRWIVRGQLSISCSTAEAFGLPVAEALAIGAPVLCSAIPAHLETMKRAEAGEDFPSGDDGMLAEAVERILCGQLPRLASGVPRGWDWTTRAREHVDAYERVLLA
jgi:glycosyltransferase involved in cell wall biosynthesis